MVKLLVCLCFKFLVTLSVSGQVNHPGMTGHFDFIALGKVSVEDFVDVYCLNDLSAPPSQEWPYAVSSNHEHEFHINLAFIDIKYRMVKEGLAGIRAQPLVMQKSQSRMLALGNLVSVGDTTRRNVGSWYYL